MLDVAACGSEPGLHADHGSNEGREKLTAARYEERAG